MPTTASVILVLQVEYILQRTIEFVSPEMRAGFRLDELSGDAHAIAGFAHAAFQHVPHAQLPIHLTDVG